MNLAHVQQIYFRGLKLALQQSDNLGVARRVREYSRHRQ